MRKIFFWLHLTAGVCAGSLILIMCVTGTLLTYERQINSWADHRNISFTAPAAGTARLSPEALIAKVHAGNGQNPTAVAIYADAGEPAEITLGREGSVLADPYTGAILGQPATGTRGFFRVVKNWHRWLGMAGPGRNTGQAIMDAGNLVFFGIVLSGLYLWLPRKMTWLQFRQVLWFRRGLSGRARDFNWHSVIGVWAWVPLVAIVGCGVVMSYRWASNFVYTATGSPLPAAQGGEPGRGENRLPPDYEGLNRAWATAEARLPGWTSIRVQIPANASAPLTFNLDKGDGGQPQSRATLSIERGTGAVVSWVPFSAGSLGQRIRILMRFTHTGESLGIFGQTIAGLATAGGALMVYTGISLALRRLFAWRRRMSSRETAPQEQEQLV